MARSVDLPDELWCQVFEQRFVALPFDENASESGNAAESALSCACVSRRWKVRVCARQSSR
jgi:hypothetical protein